MASNLTVDRPRRRRRHPDEVQDHEGAAPGRRAQHDRPRARRGAGDGAAAGRRRGRPPARAGRARTSRSWCPTPCSRSRRPRTAPAHAVRVAMEACGATSRHRRRGHRRHPAAARARACGRSPRSTRRPSARSASCRGVVAEPVRLRPDRARRRGRRRGDRRGEGRDAASSARSREINSGILAFDAEFLVEALPRIGNDNAKGEYYLTDTVRLARDDGLTVGAYPIDDVMQTEGANDRAQLAALGRELNRRIVTRWMHDGVTVMDPATTWIDADVVLAPDVTILPGTQLLGATVVGRGRRDRPGHHAQGLRDRRRRPRRPHPRRARGDRRRRQRRPVLLPAPRHPARRRRQDRRLRGDQERRRSATAPRCRTCPTSATPRSARAPTSAPARSSPTTTASPKHRTDRRAGTPRPAPTTPSSPRSTIGDGAVTGGGTVVRRRRAAGRAGGRPAARSATSRAGPQRSAPGTAAGATPRRPQRHGWTRHATSPRRSWADRPPVGQNPERTRIAGDRGAPTVSGMKRTTEKNLMVFSGRAHPELAEEVADAARQRPGADVGVRVRQLRDLRPLRGVGPRLRRVRDPEPHGSDQRVDHGAPDHGRRAQAGLGQADHRGACRSTATPARTRSTAAASRSRPG